MVCSSLQHDGAELLGRREGLEGYVERGKTFGISLLDGDVVRSVYQSPLVRATSTPPTKS